MLTRYRQLHLESGLSRSYDYVEACQELHLLLRQAYQRAPKAVQLLMYSDVLSAFRLLAGLDTSEQLAAANLVLQAAEVALPKQRRSIAVSEYKQAAVAFHRRAKRVESEEPPEFPFSADVLVHIFGFLDARSLVRASAVSRAWFEASNDDGLWRAQFLSLFAGVHAVPSAQEPLKITPGSKGFETHGYWRKAFEFARQGRPSRLFATNRAYCLQCRSALWISEGPWVQKDMKGCLHWRIKTMTASQVHTYVRGRTYASSSSSSSSSDSDTDDGLRAPRRRLWAY